MRFRGSVTAPQPLSAAVAIATIRFPKLRSYGGGTSTFLFCLTAIARRAAAGHSLLIRHSGFVILLAFLIRI